MDKLLGLADVYGETRCRAGFDEEEAWEDFWDTNAFM